MSSSPTLPPLLPPNSSTEPSPKKTYRMMAGMAVAVAGLIGLAIYSLSQMNSLPQTAAKLPIPVIHATLRQNVPQFEYSDEGKTLKAQNFEGHWTLLTFWANWCGPCLEEMPGLNQLSQQWQGPEFEILTVNTDDAKSESVEAAKKFLTDESIVLPTLFDSSGQLKKSFGVTELPRHFLINPEVKIVWEEKGAFRWNEAKTRDQLMKIMEDSSESEQDAINSTSDSSPEEAPGTPRDGLGPDSKPEPAK